MVIKALIGDNYYHQLKSLVLQTHFILENSVQQGVKKGVIMGRQEGSKEIAKNMLSDGYSVKTVAKISDLPIHVVQKLKDEILVY